MKLTEAKNSVSIGSEITYDQAKTFYNRGYIDLIIYNDKGDSIKIPAWHSTESQKEISRKVDKNNKETILGNKVDLEPFDTIVDNAKKQLGNNIKFTTSSPETNKGYTNQEIKDTQTIKKTGIAYKLFLLKNGKLYPPMIKNPGLVNTPIGKWIKCGALEFTEISASWGKPKAKDSDLAFRPGWHLGEAPYAPQFESTNNKGYMSNDKFVWAECEYNAELDYQDRAKSYGYTKDGKFTHSAMGLPYRPENGYYKMRTNPNPDTIAWIITGEMKVNRILGDDEVKSICSKMGVPYLKRKGGDKTVQQLNIKESLKENIDKSKIEMIDDFIEDIYDLRKESITNDGEYGLGNLVFKELRAYGYLDNLKELKNDLLGKELSLEKLQSIDESLDTNIYNTKAKLNKIKKDNKLENGTFSIDDEGNTKREELKSGYMVSFFRPEIEDENIKNVLNIIGDKLGTVYLGVYGDPEISYCFNSKLKAIKFAKLFNQYSIWDNAIGDEILNNEYDDKKQVNYNDTLDELKKIIKE